MRSPPETPRGPAAAQAERVLARGVAIFRLGTVPLLAAAQATVAPSDPAFGPLLVVVLVAAGQSLIVAATYWRAGRLRSPTVAADLLGVAGALAAAGVVTGGHGLSPLYNAALIAALEAGVAPWPVWAVALATVPFVTLTVAATGPDYPLWNALPDALNVPGSVLVAWVVSWLTRRVHAEHDRLRAETAAQAAELAGERDRARRATVLRTHVLGTLEAVLAADALGAPAVADRLRTELRALTAAPEEVPGLPEGLVALRAEMAARGLTVTLTHEHPDPPPDRARRPSRETPTRPAYHQPARPPASAVRAAALDAVRESLANVIEHAGTTEATVTVRYPDDVGGIVLEVFDAGTGYDPALVAPGAGQRGSIVGRIADVGGAATIGSVPGEGTRVVIRLPADPGRRSASR